MANILVIKLGSFGDLLAIEGALRDIRNHHKNDKLYFLTTSPYESIMLKCPWVNEVLIDERKPRWRVDALFRLKRKIQSIGFNIVYDLQNSYRTDFYFKYLFSELTWSGTAKNSAFYINRNFNSNGLKRLEKQLELTSIAPSHTSKPQPDWLNSNNDSLIKKHNIKSDYIVLLYGSSKGNQDKRWPYFQELANTLNTMGKTVVGIPGPDEMEYSKNIKAINILNGQKPVNFFDMTFILKNAAFVVGNDSGPTYLAAFLGIPGLVIIGPHKTDMPNFLINTNFKLLQKNNIANITIDEILGQTNKFL